MISKAAKRLRGIDDELSAKLQRLYEQTTRDITQVKAIPQRRAYKRRKTAAPQVEEAPVALPVVAQEDVVVSLRNADVTEVDDLEFIAERVGEKEPEKAPDTTERAMEPVAAIVVSDAVPEPQTAIVESVNYFKIPGLSEEETDYISVKKAFDDLQINASRNDIALGIASPMQREFGARNLERRRNVFMKMNTTLGPNGLPVAMCINVREITITMMHPERGICSCCGTSRLNMFSIVPALGAMARMVCKVCTYKIMMCIRYNSLLSMMAKMPLSPGSDIPNMFAREIHSKHQSLCETLFPNRKK